MIEPGGHRRRLLGFAVVVLLAVGGLVAYLVVERRNDVSERTAAAVDEAGRARLPVEDVLAVPHYVVRNTEPGPSYGRIALIPMSDPSGPRAVIDVECERVSATASGAICLQKVDALVPGYRTVFLDSRFREVATQDLPGVPSRARISSGGSYTASTVFVAGHSYAQAQFSTETVITETAGHRSLGNLESWRTAHDGVEVDAQDRNFWGVSFVGDGPDFYATLGTGGHRYLVRGNVESRTMTVIGEDAGCPSVSPDGETVVLKEEDPVSRAARFAALDAGSGDRVPLEEGRAVDDQVVWDGPGTVLYAVGKGVAQNTNFDVWALDLDGGTAGVLIPDAASPSVVAEAAA